MPRNLRAHLENEFGSSRSFVDLAKSPNGSLIGLALWGVMRVRNVMCNLTNTEDFILSRGSGAKIRKEIDRYLAGKGYSPPRPGGWGFEVFEHPELCTSIEILSTRRRGCGAYITIRHNPAR